MTRLFKTFLFFEILVCFGPTFLSLVTGVIFVFYFAPTWLSRTPLDFEIGATLMLFAMLGGVLGMVAVISLFIKIIKPSARVLSPSKLKFFALCGIVAVLGITWWTFGGVAFSNYVILVRVIIQILPVIAIIHLAYLGRSYLFNTAVNTHKKPGTEE